MYRLQVHGPDKVGLGVLPFHDISRHLRKAEEQGTPLPIAVAVGVNPLLSVMACTPIGPDESEYEYAAALNGGPQEVAKAVTSALHVPAGAEFVIEGKVYPGSRSPCRGARW